jgi:hypothetical protein
MSAEQLDNLEQLGLRAVACKHWRWQDGMKAVVPSRHDGATGYTVRVESGYVAKAGEYPDLTDNATLGCLVALVRQAWKAPDLAAIRSVFKDRSVVWSFPLTRELREKLGLMGGHLGGATEAEAFVVALEAAP